MKNRIIQFLKENDLTSTRFADVIGVQRSSISHILSGRNKPSFDFIEKMLIAYPDINAQWLITGKGNMSNNQPDLFSQNQNNTAKIPPRESVIQTFANNHNHITQPEQEINEKDDSPRKIERIVIFYTDSSFKEYKPQ
ncbi:MAG: hypothetical protein A2X13_12830 [Bacteroidetes bacterium GWC2_33_15]|nr:MAG: hypothetical protein A2X10_13865 [Bacteroidetes bacterium GWA2_33_15]OFX50666.1 MAG: hypothetical protein A2X13_12830 [Bacteroidetes bacterium GWC2_33_15]OFX63238.1 MAG: hypothetical protein A2X15_01970 [Bacteroidetes bacterium GWB2_32_14]OFX69815.1 MAG: hypothetical protein A2X14_05505 [Bacteroidetes bacterium GWD2_33_33]HAN19858.1 transcriptional regulator [Bacteroidales bacterium]